MDVLSNILSIFLYTWNISDYDRKQSQNKQKEDEVSLAEFVFLPFWGKQNCTIEWWNLDFFLRWNFSLYFETSGLQFELYSFNFDFSSSNFDFQSRAYCVMVLT